MCDDVSVLCWLKKLRYNFEYYEPYDVYTFSLDDDSFMEETIYENLWQCVGRVDTKSPELEVKYGEICCIAEDFLDQVDILETVPTPVLVYLDFEVPEDVMLWKNDIRRIYCEEEQNILENQVKGVFNLWRAAFDNSNCYNFYFFKV